MTKNQNGYTMLLAIGCLLIVTILGLSLMRITSSTYTKNETRADHIQADALATKGADYLVAELNYLLEKEATTIKAQVKIEADKAYKTNQTYDGYSELKKRLKAALDNILEDYSCDNAMFMGDSVVNNIDKYGYCVKLNPKLANPAAIVPAITDDDPLTWYTVPVEGSDDLQQIVALRSIGDVGAGKTESNLYLRKVIGLELGSETETGEAPGTGGSSTTAETITESLSNQADIPVALEYALTTKKSGNDITGNENGAVFLHGGVDIFGGLNIDGNLYVGNYGMPRYSSYVYSSYPRVFAHDNNLAYDASLASRTAGTVNVKGRKVVRWSKALSYESSRHASYIKNPFTYQSNYGLTDVTSGNGFSNTGVTVKDYNAEAQEFDVDFAELKTRVTEAFAANKISAKSCAVSDFNVAFLNCTNSLSISTNNTELILPKLKTSSNLSERGGVAYLKGLTISGDNVKMQGTFFVDGNFKMNGGSVNTDAVIYVTGTVDIDSSDINSLTYQLDGKKHKGTLLFFSKGKVTLNAISANSSTPSNMKAFFYSKQDLLITGSTSNVLINGGISARSIELTGMRGPTTSSSTTEWKNSCEQMTQISLCQNVDHLMTLWKNTKVSQENEKKIEDLKKEIANKVTQIATEETQIAGVQSQLAGLQTQIAEFQTQIDALQTQINQLNSKIKDIDSKLSNRRLSSSEKAELQKQKTALVDQKTPLEKQKATLETQKTPLVTEKTTIDSKINSSNTTIQSLETQKANILKQIEELDPRVKLEKQMRSRLTVYYNPDIIITYQEYSVDVKPAEIPEFTITTPSDYDRIKQ